MRTCRRSSSTFAAGGRRLADDRRVAGVDGPAGDYDHFVTPLGVFEHTPANMDFRSEGTENENHIRGYGKRDMRIFDLGWAQGERGWGNGGMSQMRFQMHATDPDRLEPLLGMRHSKGCVRIPATLNTFLDHYGILDAEYEALDRRRVDVGVEGYAQDDAVGGALYRRGGFGAQDAAGVGAGSGQGGRAHMPAGADTVD